MYANEAFDDKGIGNRRTKKLTFLSLNTCLGFRVDGRLAAAWRR